MKRWPGRPPRGEWQLRVGQAARRFVLNAGVCGEAAATHAVHAKVLTRDVNTTPGPCAARVQTGWQDKRWGTKHAWTHPQQRRDGDGKRDKGEAVAIAVDDCAVERANPAADQDDKAPVAQRPALLDEPEQRRGVESRQTRHGEGRSRVSRVHTAV